MEHEIRETYIIYEPFSVESEKNIIPNVSKTIIRLQDRKPNNGEPFDNLEVNFDTWQNKVYYIAYLVLYDSYNAYHTLICTEVFETKAAAQEYLDKANLNKFATKQGRYVKVENSGVFPALLA